MDLLCELHDGWASVRDLELSCWRAAYQQLCINKGWETLVKTHVASPSFSCLFISLVVGFILQTIYETKKSQEKRHGGRGRMNMEKKQEKLFSYLNCGLLADVIRERKLRFKWGGIFF